MGWSGHKLPKPGWFLYTRGGSSGVYIQKQGPDGKSLSEEVEIPSGILRMLIAEDIRSEKISALEQARTNEILNGITS